MAYGPQNAPTAPTELTTAIAAPPALPEKRLVERLQKMGTDAMRPQAATQNPANVKGREGTNAMAAKPRQATRKSSGRERNPRVRLAKYMERAPTPKVSVAHQPVARGEAPR